LYFLKAFNHADICGIATSWAFVVDTTSPVLGHVYDGQRPTTGSDVHDVDYQTDLSALYAHWEGFHDPHSSIKDYYVSIGTCPQCEDVLTNQAIGIVEGTSTYSR
jgi:hypothetical protein